MAGLIQPGKGQDSFELFGHRLPVSVVAIAATILVAFIVIRHRAGGTPAPAAAAAAATPFDYSAQQADAAQLSSDLASLQNQLSAASTSGTTPGTNPAAGTTPSSNYGSATYGPTPGAAGSYIPTTGGFAGVLADFNAGLPIYYQPFGASGPYVEVPGNQITPGSGYNQTFLFEPSTGSSAGGAANGNNPPPPPQIGAGNFPPGMGGSHPLPDYVPATLYSSGARGRR